MLLVKALMIGVDLIVMIIGQTLAGMELGIVESVVFAGIFLAAIAFTVLLFRNIEE